MRLIDADALDEHFELHERIATNSGAIESACAWAGARLDVHDMPTIDAVPVVRCKDCRHKDLIAAPNGYIYCTRLDICAPDDGFCHKGEMMRGDTDAVD